MGKFMQLRQKMYDRIWILSNIAIKLILCIILTLGFMDYNCKTSFLLNNMVLLVISITMFYVLLSSLNIWNNTDYGKRINAIAGKYQIVFWILLCSVQFFLCKTIYFEDHWDPGLAIIPASLQLANGEPIVLKEFPTYFYIYPNNRYIVVIYALILKIGELLHLSQEMVRLPIIFVQGVILSMTGYLLCRTISDITNSLLCTQFGFFLYMILIGSGLWSMVPYSDASCLFMPLLLFCMYRNLRIRKPTVVRMILFVILAYIAYKLKPQNIIIVIAIVLHECLTIKIDKRRLRQYLADKRTYIVIFCTVAAILSLNFTTNRLIGVSDTNKRFGLSHYLMMGLNERTNGVFAAEDIIFSDSFDNRQERTKYNLMNCIYRIYQMGPMRLLKHSIKKILTVWNDGTFAWGHEGDFFLYKIHPKSKLSTILESIFYTDGSYYPFYATIKQTVWLFCLFCYMWTVKRKQDRDIFILTLCVFGLFLFELLFEARARYIYTNVPLIILLSVMMLNNYLCDKNTV